MLALLLRLYGSDLVVNLPWGYGKIGCVPPNSTLHFDTKNGVTAACLGATAVYRVSFASFIWFFIMTTLTACLPKVHRGFFGFKAFTYFAGIIATFFIPNGVFDDNGYAAFARVASFLFLILQIAITIDFAYEWNESWTLKAEEEEAGLFLDDDETATCTSGMSKWKQYLLAISFTNYFLCILGIVLCYVFYANIDGKDNELNIIFMCLTVLFVILSTTFTLIGVSSSEVDHVTTDGNILAASLVSLYGVYLLWSSLSSNPSSYPNSTMPLTNNSNTNRNNTGASDPNSAVDAGQVFLGFAITGLTLAWTTLSASNGLSKMSQGIEDGHTGTAADLEYQRGKDTDGDRTPLMSSVGKEKKNFNDETATEDDADIEAYRRRRGKGGASGEDGDGGEDVLAEDPCIWRFHLIMMWGSIYLSMLVTNWNADSSIVGKNAMHATSRGLTAMWVKIVSQWITFALYIWTVFAPLLFPNYFYQEG